MKDWEHIPEQIVRDYAERTTGSCREDRRARRSLPGGDTRWSTYYQPYPLHMAQAEGCMVEDVDGSRYIDFQNNYTVLVHGHRPPEVMQAVLKQLNRDLIFGAPVQAQYELADLLASRLPGVDSLRYTNSGTEATMMAMRAARACKGRDVILKMDGGYHGSHDFTEVNITPDPAGGPRPTVRVESEGVPRCVLDGVMAARFNDLSSAEAILAEHAERIAAVIVEPVMNTAGIISADPAYLRGLREMTRRHDVLLIFDEIVTLRLHEQGLQGKYGVIPDITALGKVIGGGFAIGAFGGSREVMQRFDPAVVGGLHHSGTFNGHPVAMAAGTAAMKALTSEAIAHIDRLGERLLAGIREVAKTCGISEHTTREGSLIYTHWSLTPIVSADDVPRWKKQAALLPKLLHMELLNRGIFTANRGLMNISTPMDDATIDRAVEGFAAALKRIRPYVEGACPHLML